MTGRALGGDLHHQSIFVTVGGDGLDVLIVAAGLSLAPQAVSGAAEKAGALFCQRDCQTLPAHIGQGQHILGGAVHHNGRNQTLFVEFQFFRFYHGTYLTKI